MPHLQFEVNKPISDAAKISIAQQVKQLFSAVMETGVDHISISIRELDTHNLFIGRVEEPEKGIAVVNADIREGRTIAQRRTLTLGIIDLLHTALNIPKKHVYVTLTEHKAEDFHVEEKYLLRWQMGENPLAD